MSNNLKYGAGLVAILIIAGLISYFALFYKSPAAVGPNLNSLSSPSATPSVSSVSLPSSQAMVWPPIGRALERVTKKPFGLKVSPSNSPVSPERFSGYHTGVDFETFVEEQDIDVPIFAICGGPLLIKEFASGYGGVAVQQCVIAGQTVTVIYGHLKLVSISAAKDQQLVAGDKLGILGKGYSTETDGERKHLHLGIHKGLAISILGYVQNPADLQNWLDVTQFLK